MNKKIFTLLAGSLMLFMAVFSTNAQRPWVGEDIQHLKTTGDGAYHLRITGVGTATASGDQILALDSFGFVGVIDQTDWGTNGLSPTYTQLREALWCVSIDRPSTSMGVVPVYTFTNKEYSTNLAVLNGALDSVSSLMSEAPGGETHILVQRYPHYPTTNKMAPGTVYSSGDQEDWYFSRTFDDSPLQKDMFLRVECDDDPDFFLTFASTTPNTSNPTGISLVKVHLDDFQPTSAIYPYLVRFTIVNAAPRVLDAEDFNTKLGTLAQESLVDLLFTRDVTKGRENVFTQQPLWAQDADGLGDSHYLYLRTAKNSGDYIYVVDNEDEYLNEYGTRYPAIKLGAKQDNGSDQFRLVYYPSEDSLIINVQQVNDHPQWGTNFDDLTGSYPVGDYLYNATIWNYLIVRIQDLSTDDDRLLTVGDKPANTRIHFGIKECGVYDTNRTTVEPDLYTVRDVDGCYLVVPLIAGDFTPQWVKMSVDSYNGNDTIEKALKTPSYQWFVTKVDASSNTSRIFLTNREFDFIRLEYVQIYKTPTNFTASWSMLTDTLNPGSTYVVDGKAKVSVDGFSIVKDDGVAAAKKAELVAKYGTAKVGTARHQVEAWMEHMPQDLMQKLYRTSPFLGYKAILPDTLNFYGYSFNFFHQHSPDFYLGVSDEHNKDNKDTTLYVDEERTFFELLLPDTLRAYGREKYGLGHGANSLYVQNGKSDIAPLERYYYYFKINDYYKFLWNDNFLVLDNAGRYGYTNEANANARELNKAKFYMRFTHEKNDTEYYTLLDRIDKANFEYLTKINQDLSITNEIKPYDGSHGGIKDDAFGVIQAAVDNMNLYVRARVKALSVTNASFAIGQMQDELYRRFNTDLEECGRGEQGDEPRTLKFYRYNNPLVDYVYEDEHGPYSVPNSGIRFMGVENISQCSTDKGYWHADHNYAIYVDTAYVNRGTGIIKPQYMLVMNPVSVNVGDGCIICGDSVDLRSGIYGRYLRNMTDSARVNGTPKGAILNKNYIWNTTWERLAFTEAIHMGDSLYILNGTPISALYSKDDNGKDYLNYAKEDYPNIKIVNLANNYHKDEVFSMRFVERQRDKLGNKIEGASKRFFMESETTNRDWTSGRMIAPMNGGWVKWQNYVPVISRGSFTDPILEAEEWEVECAGVNDKPTDNNDIATAEVTVIAGNGSVTILNASGKAVVLSNVLGQTVAKEVLTSDNQTLSSPKGVIVVAIEGEDAIKTIVK